MCTHTQEDSEIYQMWTQSQANQNDWPKETWKKWPIKVIQNATRVWLSNSLSEPTHVSIYTYCTCSFLLINTLFHYFHLLWEFFSAKPKSQGLCHWPLVYYTCCFPLFWISDAQNWMNYAPLTQWTWVWANSRRCWRTVKPGMLQSMGEAKSQTWLSHWTTTMNINSYENNTHELEFF